MRAQAPPRDVELLARRKRAVPPEREQPPERPKLVRLQEYLRLRLALPAAASAT